ncbi:hypothetical protein UPYG_G00026010 [Umbra pygmaea]|uniref:TTF-type domain-containing protein n=1 Tax=Umbra pygmaea TaxID=75934 RepID=A0ABD0XPV7_UMBPY
MFLQAPQPGQVPGKAPRRATTVTTSPYELKRERKFVNSWRDEFDWVRYEEGVLFCCVCRGQLNLADNSSSLVKGTSAFRHDTLLSHGISKRHQHCAVAEKAKGLAEHSQTATIQIKLVLASFVTYMMWRGKSSWRNLGKPSTSPS